MGGQKLLEAALGSDKLALSPARRSVIDLVGRTPLVKINKITAGLPPDVSVYAKLEGFNPGGSVKDRAALSMIEEAESTGRLTHDKVILDSTSGNTGIAYAWIGAVKGYKVELVVPANVSEERKKILNAFGAHVIFSNPLEGSDGAIRLAWKIYVENPEKYCKLDHTTTPTTRSHYDRPECGSGGCTHFVASSTGGDDNGTGRRPEF